MAAGAIFVAMSVAQPRVMRRALETEIAEIRQLDAELRAIYGDYINAPTRADSNAQWKQIQERDIQLVERTLHLPERHAAIEGWWRGGGTGTIVFGLGSAFLIAGVVLTLLNRRASRI